LKFFNDSLRRSKILPNLKNKHANDLFQNYHVWACVLMDLVFYAIDGCLQQNMSYKRIFFLNKISTSKDRKLLLLRKGNGAN
jgi:hypothetical protein